MNNEKQKRAERFVQPARGVKILPPGTAQVPPPPPALRVVKPLALSSGFDPNQPRDNEGQWTDTDSSPKGKQKIKLGERTGTDSFGQQSVSIAGHDIARLKYDTRSSGPGGTKEKTVAVNWTKAGLEALLGTEVRVFDRGQGGPPGSPRFHTEIFNNKAQAQRYLKKVLAEEGKIEL